MSMGNEIVAKRYAVALFDLVQDAGTLAEVEQEVEAIQTLFKSNEVRDFFAHPKITAEQKKTLLNENLTNKVSSQVINTLFLMIDRKRGDSIAEMIEQFIALAMEEQRVAEAVIYSVKPLTDEQQQTISTLIAEKVGKQSLRIQNKINPDLIGGLRIRVGNQIFDGSISGRLESMKRELTVKQA